MLRFLQEMAANRKFLWSLILNDFKQKYVGNFLGILWAFIQPTATILIFWFVFEVGFKSQPVGDVPFILWLIAGMLPWFYFSEALGHATQSLVSNAFLIKKIPFRVALLPMIPLFSTLVVHLFFLLFMVGMFLFYHQSPAWSWLQLFYYLFAMFVLLMGLAWITSSVVVFFRDMGQVVGMFLQFGFWLTPIFWSMEMVPERYHWLIRLNPLVYIIEGYRDALIDHRWFWEKPWMGLYFWVVALLFFGVGVWTFQRLRPHFADVL